MDIKKHEEVEAEQYIVTRIQFLQPFLWSSEIGFKWKQGEQKAQHKRG